MSGSFITWSFVCSLLSACCIVSTRMICILLSRVFIGFMCFTTNLLEHIHLVWKRNAGQIIFFIILVRNKKHNTEMFILNVSARSCHIDSQTDHTSC